MSLSITTTSPSIRNSESPRSRHNTTSTTMATTPAFAFMGQGTSSATVAARVTPAAASGTTAAPPTTTLTTATSVAAAGAVVTPSSATTTIPAWNNGASSVVATTAVPVVGVNAPFSGLIFGAPATGTSTLTSTTTAVAGGGTATPLFAAGGISAPPSTGGGSAAVQMPAVPTTTTTTHTAGRFTPVRFTETPTNVWGTNASTNPINFFGNQAAVTRLASAGTPPGPGRFFNNFATRPSLALATTQPATTSTSVFTPSIANQAPQLQCTKEIRFRFEWAPENIAILLGTGLTQQFRVREGDVDALQCSLLQTPDTFKMTLDFSTTNLKGNNQSWLQTVSVFTIDQKRLTSVAVFWPSVRQVHCCWPKANTTLAKNAAGLYGVDVLLSSEKSGTHFNVTTSTTYTDHCDSILGKMLDDPSSYDVFFEFDPPESYAESVVEVDTFDSETGSTGKIEAEDEEQQHEDSDDSGVKRTKTTAADDAEETTKETNGSSSTSLLDTEAVGHLVDNVDRGRDMDHGQDRGLRWSLNKTDPQDEEVYVDAFDAKVVTSVNHVYAALDNTSDALVTPPTTTKSASSIVEKLGAHKIVLSQYEYFKTMFSSSFAEGGPGVKRIKIKDSDIHCFRLLIQFLYLGRLRPRNAPTVLTQDCATLRHLPSWEDVYLIADRYSIAELKTMAGTRIIQGLSSEWAVAFLFRTGYLFEEMRHALIKYVVKNNMDEISHRKTQEAYFAHPECTAIFGEIIAELWAGKASH